MVKIKQQTDPRDSVSSQWNHNPNLTRFPRTLREAGWLESRRDRWTRFDWIELFAYVLTILLAIASVPIIDRLGG